MVIVAPDFRTSDYTKMLAAVAPHCLGLSDVVFVGSDRWDELAGAEADLTVLKQIAAKLRNSDPINVQYTSNTKMYPKVVTLSHRNILNDGYLVGESLEYIAYDGIFILVALLCTVSAW